MAFGVTSNASWPRWDMPTGLEAEDDGARVMVAGWCFSVGTGQLILTSAFTQKLQKNHRHLSALAFGVL